MPLQLAGGDDQPGFSNRAHFFGAAAQAMRRILIDRARRKHAEKRGSGAEHIDLDSVDVAVQARLRAPGKSRFERRSMDEFSERPDEWRRHPNQFCNEALSAHRP